MGIIGSVNSYVFDHDLLSTIRMTLSQLGGTLGSMRGALALRTKEMGGSWIRCAMAQLSQSGSPQPLGSIRSFTISLRPRLIVFPFALCAQIAIFEPAVEPPERSTSHPV
jgi:hypothetical protein